MKRPINNEMIRMEDVMSAIDKAMDDIRCNSKKEHLESNMELIDKIKRSIVSLEKRRRLVIINGGKE